MTATEIMDFWTDVDLRRKEQPRPKLAFDCSMHLPTLEL